MSCHEGHNSVITSIVKNNVGRKGHKAEDEKTINTAFHTLVRKEKERIKGGAAANLTPDAHPDDRAETLDTRTPADPNEVVEWLRGQAAEVRNNPTLKDNKKQQWGAKLDAAVAATRRGEGPTIVQFHAWRNLQPAAEAALRPEKHKDRWNAYQSNPANIAGGETGVRDSITLLNTTMRELEGLRTGRHGYDSAIAASEARKARETLLPKLRRQTQDLVRGYDQTPAGQRALADGSSSDFDAAFPGGRSERLGNTPTTPAAPANLAPLSPTELANTWEAFNQAHSAGDREAARSAFRNLAAAIHRHPGYTTYNTWSDADAASQKNWRRVLQQPATSATTDTFDTETVRRAYRTIFDARTARRVAEGELTREQADTLQRSVENASRKAHQTLTQHR